MNACRDHDSEREEGERVSTLREWLVEQREAAIRIAYGPSADDVDRGQHLAFHLGKSTAFSETESEIDRRAKTPTLAIDKDDRDLLIDLISGAMSGNPEYFDRFDQLLELGKRIGPLHQRLAVEADVPQAGGAG